MFVYLSVCVFLGDVVEAPMAARGMFGHMKCFSTKITNCLRFVQVVPLPSNPPPGRGPPVHSISCIWHCGLVFAPTFRNLIGMPQVRFAGGVPTLVSVTHRPNGNSGSSGGLDLDSPRQGDGDGEVDVKMESDSKTDPPAPAGSDMFAHTAPSQQCFHCLTAFSHCAVLLVKDVCQSAAWSQGGDAVDVVERCGTRLACIRIIGISFSANVHACGLIQQMEDF